MWSVFHIAKIRNYNLLSFDYSLLIQHINIVVGEEHLNILVVQEHAAGESAIGHNANDEEIANVVVSEEDVVLLKGRGDIAAVGLAAVGHPVDSAG